MANDDRDLLTVLKAELAFLEKGGYRHSPSARWRPQFIFEDSPTCMNHGRTRESPALQRVHFDESRSCGLPQREDSLPAHSPQFPRVHDRHLLSLGDARRSRGGAGGLASQDHRPTGAGARSSASDSRRRQTTVVYWRVGLGRSRSCLENIMLSVPIPLARLPMIGMPEENSSGFDRSQRLRYRMSRQPMRHPSHAT